MNESRKAQESQHEREIAELHAELAVSFPDSYTWKEKKEICEDMDGIHGSKSDMASGLRTMLLGELPELPEDLLERYGLEKA